MPHRDFLRANLPHVARALAGQHPAAIAIRIATPPQNSVVPVKANPLIFSGGAHIIPVKLPASPRKSSTRTRSTTSESPLPDARLADIHERPADRRRRHHVPLSVHTHHGRAGVGAYRPGGFDPPVSRTDLVGDLVHLLRSRVQMTQCYHQSYRDHGTHV